ncbi:MAG: hypothetical protein KF889_12375 [Alphaproteobacteria bacterium]|nr:hypothetical protein [Alphaproteobacteria bacterium]MCW5739212.1 hypothetical protein [Alphaproteobacteria bacterium]
MPRTGPAGLRVIAVALAMGGVMIGILMPVLLFHLGITVAEIAPGFDVIWVLFPAIAIVDWIVAYHFWRKASPPASRDGPVVG